MHKPKYATAPVPSPEMPPGIPYIVGNEAAERFSFYGMRAILFIFMTQHLLGPDGSPDLMTETEAQAYYHWFVAGVYFFPFFGAVLADAFLGKYRTIVSLSLVYCLGHLALALGDVRAGLLVHFSGRLALMTGLVLIAVGSGGIKSCVSAHVGDQFGATNQHLMSKMFSWFYFAINVGAVVSMWLTPRLLDYFTRNAERFGANYGPTVAFGVPGLVMALATLVFWMGRYKFVHIPPGGWKFVKETFSREGLTAVGKLCIIYVFIVPFWAIFDQTGSSWIAQATKMDRYWLGIRWLPSEIQAVNSILVLVMIPSFAYGLYPLVGKVFPLTALRRISLGLFVTTLACASAVWIQVQIDAAPQQEVLDRAYAKLTDGGSRPVTLDVFLTGREDETGRRAAVELFEKLDQNEDGRIAAHEWTHNALPQVFAHLDRDGDGRLTPAELGALSSAKDGVAALFERLDANRDGTLNCPPPGAIEGTGSLAYPEFLAGGAPGIYWQLVAYVIITAAEVMVAITALEFSYTQAPKKAKSLVMGLFLLSISVGNVLTSTINEWNQNPDGSTKITETTYFGLFTALAAAAAVAFVLVAALYRERTYIQDEQPAG
jgi:dipeptide/tripeptide permease/Ca2+-binding EF-hand superfamily protein